MILYKKGFGAFNLLGRIYGSSWPRAFVLAVPSTVFGALLRNFGTQFTVGHLFLHPYPYSVFASILAFVLVFRVNLSYARYWEGRSMLAQMSSKWADAALLVVSFDEAGVEAEGGGGRLFRAQFLHSMSLMHGLAMQRLRGDLELKNLRYASPNCVEEPPSQDAADNQEWIQMRGFKSYLVLRSSLHHVSKYFACCPIPVIGGLSSGERAALGDTQHDRVFLVMAWIHRLLVKRRGEGGVRQEPPLVARIFQFLSDGMLGFENAHKICTSPFPFPYAQCVALLLHINALGIPLMMAEWVGEVWLAAFATFVSVFSFYLMNEVAREIEEPFHYHPNDLPVAYFQYRFNSLMVKLAAKEPQNLFEHIDPNDACECKKAHSVDLDSPTITLGFEGERYEA